MTPKEKLKQARLRSVLALAMLPYQHTGKRRKKEWVAKAVFHTTEAVVCLLAATLLFLAWHYGLTVLIPYRSH